MEVARAKGGRRGWVVGVGPPDHLQECFFAKARPEWNSGISRMRRPSFEIGRQLRFRFARVCVLRCKEASQPCTDVNGDARLRLRLRRGRLHSQQGLKTKPGGAERDRTVDLLNAIQALSQLSYGPTGTHFVANGVVCVNGHPLAGWSLISKQRCQVMMQGSH